MSGYITHMNQMEIKLSNYTIKSFNCESVNFSAYYSVHFDTMHFFKTSLKRNGVFFLIYRIFYFVFSIFSLEQKKNQ